MSRLLTATTAAALLASGAAIQPAPAQAWGYGNSSNCWYETSLIQKLSFNCTLITRDRMGRYIYLCCN